jgi:hypothetical protein
LKLAIKRGVLQEISATRSVLRAIRHTQRTGAEM